MRLARTIKSQTVATREEIRARELDRKVNTAQAAAQAQTSGLLGGAARATASDGTVDGTPLEWCSAGAELPGDSAIRISVTAALLVDQAGQDWVVALYDAADLGTPLVQSVSPRTMEAYPYAVTFDYVFTTTDPGPRGYLATVARAAGIGSCVAAAGSSLTVELLGPASLITVL